MGYGARARRNIVLLVVLAEWLLSRRAVGIPRMQRRGLQRPVQA